jgi:hypothetical protein
LNLYAYVGNRPVNAVDAVGLSVYVCSRKVKGFPFVGNHTYFYDTAPTTASGNCQSCGLGASSGVGASSGSGSTSSGDSLCGHEKGPGLGGDVCSKVPDSDGSAGTSLMNCCRNTANSGIYFPGIRDCHNAVNRCLEQNNFTVPSAPRLGPPSVGPIEQCQIEPLPPSPPHSPPPPGPPGKR